VLAYRGGIVFFRLGNGVEGHTAVLALFDVNRNPERGDPQVKPSMLHHLALSLNQTGQQFACKWFDTNTISYKVEAFDGIGWCGVFVSDPDGNIVELVSAGWPIAG